jgi:5-formyltetrahydrofolate cyclo-ligase
MLTFNVRTASTILVSVVLLGCAASPTHKPVQDRTPSWMKYQVTGSRITRRTDGRGASQTADSVKSTSPAELVLLPGVTFDPIAR